MHLASWRDDFARLTGILALLTTHARTFLYALVTGAEMRTLQTDLPPGRQPIGEVHLLFRPGHYDLLYPATEEDRRRDREKELERQHQKCLPQPLQPPQPPQAPVLRSPPPPPAQPANDTISSRGYVAKSEKYDRQRTPILAAWDFTTSTSKKGAIMWTDHQDAYLLHLYIKSRDAKLYMSSNAGDAGDEAMDIPRITVPLEFFVEVTTDGFWVVVKGVSGSNEHFFAHRAPWSTFKLVKWEHDGWTCKPRAGASPPLSRAPHEIRDAVANMTQAMVDRGFCLSEVQACINDMTVHELCAMTSGNDFGYLQVLLDSRRVRREDELMRQRLREQAIHRMSEPQVVDTARVIMLCPETTATSKAALLKSQSGYVEIVSQICSKHSFDIDPGEAVLARVDKHGWSLKVSSSDKTSSECSISICDLEEKDRIELRRLTSCVRGRFRLRVIAATDRFNSSLQDKIASLSETYAGYQEIRGDGNCYYRAIIFGLIEQIISDPSKRKLLLKIRDRFEQLVFRAGPELVHHEALLQKLKQAAGELILGPSISSLFCETAFFIYAAI